MIHGMLLSIFLAIISTTACATELYRWKDAAGIVHYSDKPVTDAQKLDTRKFSAQSSTDKYLPYATRRAQQNFPVTLYVSPDCGEVCQEARQLLKKRSIPYAEKTFGTKEELEKLKSITGKNIVPTLKIGKTTLYGLLAEQWHDQLDTAGYPKSPPYRPANNAPVEVSEPVAPEDPIKSIETPELELPPELTPDIIDTIKDEPES